MKKKLKLSNEKFEPTFVIKCKCGNPGELSHTCPYSEDVNNSKRLCNCCKACRRACAEDI